MTGLIDRCLSPSRTAVVAATYSNLSPVFELHLFCSNLDVLSAQSDKDGHEQPSMISVSKRPLKPYIFFLSMKLTVVKLQTALTLSTDLVRPSPKRPMQLKKTNKKTEI